MIALLAAASLALFHRKMWVTPGYVLADTGTLVGVRTEDSGDIADHRTRHLGSILTAAPLKSGGFVYVNKHHGVRTWTSAGVTKLSSLPEDADLEGDWKIFPFTDGKMLLQKDGPTAASNGRIAYLYESDQAWHIVRPDMQLNGSVIMQGTYLRLFPVDENNQGHVNFTRLGLDTYVGLPEQLGGANGPIIGHGGPMQALHIINLDLGGFKADQAIETDNDNDLAFANDTTVAVFGGENHQKIAGFAITDLQPQSLVVAQDQSGQYLLYGMDHEGTVRKHAPAQDSN